MQTSVFSSAENFPVRGGYDVVVVGAGPGGFSAAIAAARAGMKTLLIERYGFPGGVATTCCCPYLMGYSVGARQIIGGIGDELVRRLDKMGEARIKFPGTGLIDPAPIGDRRLDNVVISIEGMRIVVNRLLAESGAETLFYTSMIGAMREGNRIGSIVVDNIDGLGLIKAKVFIDATANAELAFRAGFDTVTAPAEDAMTKTILIRLGNVNNFKRDLVVETFNKLFEAGKVPYKNQDNFMGGPLLHPGEFILNFTLTIGDALSARDMTRMDGELREQILVTVDWYRKNIPGFENCFLMDSAVHVGVRASRNIVGLETITCQGIDDNVILPKPVSLGRRGYGGHGLKSFTDGKAKSYADAYPIPLGALIPAGAENLLASGRAISAEAGALSCFRLMSNCCAIGQGAGVVAAVAAEENCPVAAANYDRIRERLLAGKAILD
jgi:hypothetical protein